MSGINRDINLKPEIPGIYANGNATPCDKFDNVEFGMIMFIFTNIMSKCLHLS